MDKYIIDASVVLKWFPFGEEKDVSVSRMWLKKLIDSQSKIYAPTFLLIEVANILYKKKHLAGQSVTEVVEKIKSLPIVFLDISKTEMSKIIGVMTKFEISAYDAIYVYLAVKMNCKVLTVDKPIAKTKYGVYILDQD